MLIPLTWLRFSPPVCRYLEGLTELNLSGLGIGDAGAQALAECVRQCTSLVSLDVSSNGITDSGMVALAQVRE